MFVDFDGSSLAQSLFTPTRGRLVVESCDDDDVSVMALRLVSLYAYRLYGLSQSIKHEEG